MPSTPADDPRLSRIDLHLRIRVKQGMRGEFLDFLRETIPLYESPGGIEVRLLQDLSDDHRFIELVLYRDRRTYELDRERVEHDARMRAALERWRGLLAEPPVVETFGLVEL